MAEREQILADFQACTGLDNIEECIAILEQHDWNLMPAVQNALSGLDSPGPASESTAVVENSASSGHLEAAPTFPLAFEQTIVGRRVTPQSDPGGLEAAGPAAAFGSSSAAVFPSTSSEYKPIRLLNFSIEYRDRNLSLIVPDNEVVGKLKELLQVELGVPASSQQLCWVNKNDKRMGDEQLLRDLNLPKDNSLFLVTPNISQPTKCVNADSRGDPNMLEKLTQTFTLNVHFKDQNKDFKVNFPGSKTIQEVKRDLYALSNVPVRCQVWSGWPDGADDDTMTLAGCGIRFPCHSLELSSSECQHLYRKAAQLPMDVDPPSDEDFEDAQESFNIEDEHIFDSDITGTRRSEPLMPDNIENQEQALESFAREFGIRYGECHPVFYLGRLEDAIRDSLQCKARERKLLAIYLHHDGSIQAHVFCAQILCAESIVAYLSENFIMWAWDLTTDANRARLLSMCTKHFGGVAASTVREFQPDELPLLLLISRTRAVNEVVGVIRGNTSLDELMMRLIHSVEVFNEQLKKDIIEEDEREEREQVLHEQEVAYQESLAADRAKAESRRQEEEEKRLREEEEEEKRNQEEQRKRQEEKEKEAIRQSLEQQLPDEPAGNCSEPVSTIRVRCPDGQQLRRRFLAQNPLQILLNFVASKGFHVNDFKVLTSFPRRDLTQEDPTKSLDTLKLFPQETIILEEK